MMIIEMICRVNKHGTCEDNEIGVVFVYDFSLPHNTTILSLQLVINRNEFVKIMK